VYVSQCHYILNVILELSLWSYMLGPTALCRQNKYMEAAKYS